MLTRLQEIFTQYDKAAAAARRETKGLAGIWGMGDDPRNHHCHDQFYQEVDAWVMEFLYTQPDAAAVAEAVKLILGAADERRNRESYWYSFAAQSHVGPMIPWLRAADARAIADWYDTVYTKLERLPAQRNMYKALRKAAKG